MPALGFSGAIMAVVAYGEVKGSNGASDFQNSGQYKTARTGPGSYTLTPTDGNIQTDGLSQCIVQIKDKPDDDPYCTTVSTNSMTGVITVFTVQAGSGSPQDSDFSFTVLRSTISPPAGAPA